jgi:hypothetical protein
MCSDLEKMEVQESKANSTISFGEDILEAAISN